MAGRGSNILLKITGDTSEARRELNSVKRELRDLSKQQATAHVDVQIAAAERQLLGFRRQLQELSQQKATPEVKLDTERVSRRILSLEARLARLGARRVEIDVDLRRGTAERTLAALGSIDRGAGRIRRSLENVPFFIGRLLSAPVRLFQAVIEGFGAIVQAGGALVGFFAHLGSAVVGAFQTVNDTVRGLINGTVTIGQVVGSAISAVLSALAALPALVLAVVALGAAAALAGALVSGLVVALNAVFGAIIALGGALVALVASLTAAVAGFGALAVAFGAVLLPVIAVGIALFSRFQKVLEARKAREQELAQAVQQQKTAEQQRQQALDQSRSAHQRLAETVVEGRRAMAQAAIDEQHAELALQESRLGVQNARLNLAQAKRDLRDLLSQAGQTGQGLNSLFKQAQDVHVDPKVLQGALGGAVGGGQGQIDPLELQRRILAVRQGELGVKQAVQGVGDAQRAATEAERKRIDFARRGLRAYAPYRNALEQVRKADERLARQQDVTSKATENYQRKLKALSGTERESLSRLDALMGKFKEFAKALTDPIFQALNQTFDSLKGSGNGFKQALTEVGEAFGDVVRSIGAFLREPATQTAFQTMAHGAADLVRTLGGRAFGAFLRIMREVAVTALPAVRHAAHDVANALEGVASKPGRIRSVVSSLIGQFKTWARLAGSLIGLVKDIFVPASKEGQSLADSMRHVVDHWREWIRENPKKVREFFRNSVIRARQIFNAIKDVVAWLKDHLPEAATKAKRYLEAVAKVMDTIIKGVQWLGNARRNAEHAVTGGGSLSQKDVIATSRAIQADIKTLHTHVTPEVRDQTRQRLIEAITKLEKHWVDIPQKLKDLLNRLKQAQGHASGGVVSGSGTGDTQLRWLSPGEGIIKAAMTRQLGGPSAIAALNMGRLPAMALAGGARGDTHHHYHVPPPARGGPVEPRSTLEHIHRLITLKG